MIARLVGIVVLLAAGAACSSDEEWTRPPIGRPLDASAYADRACDLLPADRATGLGYSGSGSAGSETDGEGSRYHFCLRTPPESRILSIYLYLAGDVLAARYAGSKNMVINDTGEPWLEPVTIGEQPGVTLGRSHRKPNAACTVVVGLSDTQGVEVRAAQHYPDARGYEIGPGDGRACEHAIGVAEVIVGELAG
jgi:hypothetical protein